MSALQVDRKKLLPTRPGITARLHPSKALLRSLGRLGVVDPKEALDVCKSLDELVSVDVLEKLLDEALNANCKPGGTVDMKDAAAHILRRLKEHQFSGRI